MAGNSTSTRPKITSSSFGLSTAGERLGGKYKTIKISTPEKSALKSLNNINKTLDSILKTLSGLNKQNLRESELSRRETEKKKRQSKEQGLESKTFDGIKKALSVITKPFESIFDKIWNFLYYTILGKIGIKLIDWFANPKNESKIKSLIRFVSDWWPALLGGYILFGTQFGGLIRFVGGWAIRLAFQLGKVVIPRLLSLIVKNPFASLAVAGGIGAYVATQQNKQRRDEEAKTDPSIVKPEDTAKTKKGPGPAQLQREQIGQQGLGSAFRGGGVVRYPKFSSGGFNFKGMMGGASMGAMFGPLGMLLGGLFGSGKPQGMFNGFISGERGVDKIPAMLSDGEFVMSAGAVKKYGVDTLEAMNAAGGGTNKPKIVNGKTYAAEGGPIGGRGVSYRNPDTPESSGNDSVSKLRHDLNNFMKGRGAGPNFDIGNPSTWGGSGGGTSVSGGGGTGGFLRGLGYFGRAVGQVPRVVGNTVNPALSYAQRAAGQAGKMVSPALSYAQRAAGQAGKMVSPALSYAQRAAGQVKKKVEPVVKAILGFRPDLSGIKGIVSNASGAATEAIPALLSSVLGISGTDKSISQDMQRALLQARQTAKERGRDYVDYKDYVGGGLSAGGLTMGRIADKEWKRDAQGRIIGLRQVYDTNRSSGEAWNQGMQGWGQFFKSGLKDTSALGRGIYKPFEALLAATQHRGKTMHDINFDEKVLGFKPGKEVLTPTQKRMIAEQKNREALQNKRPWWDKMGLFGGASAQKTEQQKKQEFLKKNPGAKLYDKPQKNTGQSYKSRFARPRNAGVAPVKPPVKPKPKVVRVSKPVGNGSGGVSKGNHQKAPSPSPRHPKGTGTTQRTTGTKR